MLKPATWRLELLVCGDNIRPEQSFVTLWFDGIWPQPDSPTVWEHFLIHGPFPQIAQPPDHATQGGEWKLGSDRPNACQRAS